MKVSAIIRLCGGAKSVADRLAISRQAVRRWVRVDKIPDNKIPAMITNFEHIVNRKIFEVEKNEAS